MTDQPDDGLKRGPAT